MSWTVAMVGSEEEIGKAFDATREQAAANGMIEPEQRDIDEVRDLAMQFASKHGRCNVNASGHWSGDVFARVDIAISKAMETEPPPAKRSAVRH